MMKRLIMKRLICCTDGTWDKPGDTIAGKSLDSNVCLLYNAIEEIDQSGIQQLKVYDTGVGSGPGIKDQLSGGITGAGLDAKIKDVYTFLMLNYKEGDEIYLFGFSRGAYTARSLAGFIRNCGILKPEKIDLVDRAYNLYRNRNDYTTPDSDMMRSFRNKFCIEDITRIKFIGVWDTVGSLGIPVPWFNSYNLEEYKFHDITLSSTIDYAYQALAVDERRVNFEPSIWQLSENTTTGSATVLEQRWFSGVHCNVGGGYENRGLSNNTLQWMVEKARAVGLGFTNSKLTDYLPDTLATMGNSYTWMYWVRKKIWRPVNQLKNSFQVIDDSVYERMKKYKDYYPGNIK
jgi:uncharacterized protein (DUF2235 family)